MDDLSTTAPSPRPPEEPSPSDLAPLFPQLDVLEVIGRGGMGLVYKARQKALDRLVALKVLPWRPDQSVQSGERFEREGRALACLQHQGIVAVHDSGRVGDWYYLVMEYVEGANLRQIVQSGNLREAVPNGEPVPAVENGRVKPSVVVTIISAVCDALQYAHSKGVIHRDVKPENILISQQAQIKVADFGLAKMLQRGPQDRHLTGSTQAMGTWHYVAPEQLQRPLEVDHRADVYSLGVVMYELLTGERPMGQFAPPSKKANIDTRLDAVTLKALASDPAERFQNVQEFKTALLAAWQVGPAAGALPDWAGKMINDMFGGTAQFNVGNAGNVQIVTNALMPTPVKHRHLPGTLLLVGLGVFTVGWLMTAFLWNLGIPGVGLAAIAMLAGWVFLLRRSLTHLPEMAETMSQHDGPTRGLRWAVSGALFLAACGVLLLTPLYVQDARVLEHAAEDYPFERVPQVRGYFGNSGDWQIPPSVRDRVSAALLQHEADNPKPITRGHLNSRREPLHSDPGRLAWGGGGLAVGLLLLCAASLAVPGGRTFWSAGVSLAGVVVLPYAALLGAAPLWQPRPAFGAPASLASYPLNADNMTDRIRAWAREEGKELLGGSEWAVRHPEKHSQKLGVLTVYVARNPSAFARWSLVPWPERATADSLILCLEDAKGTRCLLWTVAVGYPPSLATYSPQDGSILRLHLDVDNSGK